MAKNIFGDRIVYRELFSTLVVDYEPKKEKSEFLSYNGRYMILNDLNYVGEIYAKDDEDAIKQYKEYLKSNRA